MPRLVKLFSFIAILIALVILGLKLSGNDHVLEAVRSTYVLGRTGPDIDNHKFFENRVVAKGKKQKWKEAEEMLELSSADRKILEAYETVAFLIIRKGEIVCEEYWEDYSSESLSNSFSMAKSIVSLLMGCAIQDGHVRSVFDKASDYLPELKGTDKENITIQQLLQMTSGLGGGDDYKSPFGFMAKAYYGEELVQNTFDYPRLREPGEKWVYDGGNTLLLSYVISRATGKTLSDYASKRLWKPLGAEHDALWTYDETTGAERAYCCFYSNARDFARLGQLILCDGNWNGQQLISPDWIEQCESPALQNDGTTVPKYGYQFWMDEIAEMDVTYLRGILGQYVFVIPEKEMVVVRLGHKRSAEKKGNSPLDVHEFLDIAKRLNP